METEDRIEPGLLVTSVSATALEILNKGTTVPQQQFENYSLSTYLYVCFCESSSDEIFQVS